MTIKILQAHHGDCILIRFQDTAIRNILVDGGTADTYDGSLRSEIESIRQAGQRIDLLILTHIDDDHIGGVLRWLQVDPETSHLIDKVWFNSGDLIAEYFKTKGPEALHVHIPILSKKVSVRQGIRFEDFITSKNIWDRKIIKACDIHYIGSAKLTILSPTVDKLSNLLVKWEKEAAQKKTGSEQSDYRFSLRQLLANDFFQEDQSTYNGSSIAFLISVAGKNALFLSDSHATVIQESLLKTGYSKDHKLKTDFVKISHHGSRANGSSILFEMIESNNFSISTDGSRHCHPHKQLIARLLKSHPACNLHFNYSFVPKAIFTSEDLSDFPSFKIYDRTEINL